MKQNQILNYGFIERPVAALCVCAALLCVGVIVIFERGRTGQETAGQDFYAVSLKHYGMDAREMERSVTIPLEDALYALPGVKQITSVSDNAQSRVSVLFEAGRRGDREGRYEAVSDAAQRVYETLPESAQRPEILSHDDNRAPVWTAAVTGEASIYAANTADRVISAAKSEATSAAMNIAMDKPRLAAFLERTVKGELEAVEGVSEVQIAGVALPEVLIALDNEICARMGLSAQTVAAVLARNDILIPAGVLESGGTEINVMVDGRYRDIGELGGAFIPLPKGGYTQLRNIAAVTERERQPDILSRLNGEQTVMLIVTASPDADLGKLSRNLARNIERYEELSFEILADRGKEEIKALNSVIMAALGGSLMVALLSALMTAGSGGIRQAAASALTVPFISVLSLALLSLFQPPGKSALTGLTAGLGVAVDAAILVSEKLSVVLSKAAKAGVARFPAAKKQLRSLIPSLTAGSATTIAALAPFAFMKSTAIEMNAEMQTIALSIGVITVVSFFTALALLPPLFMNGTRLPSRGPARTGLAGKNTIVFSLLGKVSRRALRFFSRIVHTSVKKQGLVIALSAAITAAALVVVVINDPDTRMPSPEDSLYAQVEFDGGLLKEETDRKLAAFARALRQNDGVKHVETSAKTGTGNVYIMFDPKKITPEKMREIARSADISDGFVYIDELTGSERSWRISVCGDDDAQCRLIARNIAEICAGIPLVEETVLHFKSGGPRLALKPDRERLAYAGLSFAALGDTERRAVHAPVAYKRLNSAKEIGIRGETDVRIQAGRGKTTDGTIIGTPEKTDVENITLITGTGAAVSTSSLVTAKHEEEVSVIRREGRRRAASLSVRTKAIGARKARSLIMPSLEGLTLPQNYTIVFDREAIEAEEALGKSVFFIVLALLFCYIVIAMANESFFLPLIALAAVPPSLALPVLVLSAAGFKMNAALICAFIAVTGITVNASTLTVDALRGQRSAFPAVYRALRGRLRALLATGGTTIAAALPFVFLPETANLMIKTLAAVSALGVAGSCLASVTLIPALTACRFHRGFPRRRRVGR